MKPTWRIDVKRPNGPHWNAQTRAASKKTAEEIADGWRARGFEARVVKEGAS